MADGHGIADYMLFVEGKVVGVLAAKPAGYPRTSVELQADKYATGLPDVLNPPDGLSVEDPVWLPSLKPSAHSTYVSIPTFGLDLGLQTGHARPDVGSLARIPLQTR